MDRLGKYRLHDLPNAGELLEISMGVEGVARANLLWVSTSVRVVRSLRVQSGGKDPVGRKTCAMRKFCVYNCVRDF